MRFLVLGPARSGKSAFVNQICEGDKSEQGPQRPNSSYMSGCKTDVSSAIIDGEEQVFLEWLEIGGSASREAASMALSRIDMDGIVVVVDGSVPAEHSYACASVALSDLACRLVADAADSHESTLLLNELPCASDAHMEAVSRRLLHTPILLIANKYDLRSSASVGLGGWWYWLFGSEIGRTAMGITHVERWSQVLRTGSPTTTKVEVIFGREDRSHSRGLWCSGCRYPNVYKRALSVQFAPAVRMCPWDSTNTKRELKIFCNAGCNGW
jgi:hypothetical protein